MATVLRYCYLLLVALVACSSWFATVADAMHFYLKGSTSTCFGQDILRDPSEKSVRVDVYYNLHYKNPMAGAEEDEGAQMTVFLANAEQKPVKGTETIVNLKNSKSDMTSYYATQSGFYLFCFQVQAPKIQSFKAEVEIIPTNAKQEEFKISGAKQRKRIGKSTATKDAYLAKINVIDGLMKSSEEEMTHLLSRQGEFDSTVKSTYTRVIYFTLANALIVFGTAGWQMVHLKRFFKSKKLV